MLKKFFSRGRKQETGDRRQETGDNQPAGPDQPTPSPSPSQEGRGRQETTHP
ncbi:MAG: hypothetical protein F6K48_22315 [Okeania sp. SIO3H1]|nr:hypothetical protein [Okeania sp. SIO3H1]